MPNTRPGPLRRLLLLVVGFPLVLLAGLVAGVVGALTTPPAGWRGDE